MRDGGRGRVQRGAGRHVVGPGQRAGGEGRGEDGGEAGRGGGDVHRSRGVAVGRCGIGQVVDGVHGGRRVRRAGRESEARVVKSASSAAVVMSRRPCAAASKRLPRRRDGCRGREAGTRGRCRARLGGGGSHLGAWTEWRRRDVGRPEEKKRQAPPSARVQLPLKT